MPGNIKPINGTSMGANGGEKRLSLSKPNPQGSSASPGGTKPSKPAEHPVPMPK